MQKEQFESMVRELLPTASDRAMDVWTEYARNLDRDEVESESHFFDATYVELMLIKQHQGEDIAVRLFNYGEQFTFNYFELRGAASRLADGWPLDQISQYAVDNGCDPTAEEFDESMEALQAFKAHLETHTQTADEQGQQLM